MKKVGILLWINFLCSFALCAQVELKLGTNLTDLTSDLKAEYLHKNKFGFVGGLTYSIPLSSKNFIFIQPELLFSQKGYNRKEDNLTVLDGTTLNTIFTIKGKVNYSYLDLPILLKLKTGAFFFEAGPQLSYLVNITDKTEIIINPAYTNDVGEYEKIRKDEVPAWAIGYAAGLGYRTPLGFNIGLRYNGSLDTSSKKYMRDGLPSSRYSVYQATVGFALPTDK